MIKFRAAAIKTAKMRCLDDAEPFSLQSLPGDEFTWPCVLEDEVFIIKLLPIDGFAAGAVVVGEISSLAHELGDDAVEAAAFEAKSLLVGAEAAEILCEEVTEGREVRAGPGWGAAAAAELSPLLTRGHGHHVGAQQDAQPPRRLVPDLDLHVNLRVHPAFLGRRLVLGRKMKGAG